VSEEGRNLSLNVLFASHKNVKIHNIYKEQMNVIKLWEYKAENVRQHWHQ
jgi:hypothetical protein